MGFFKDSLKKWFYTNNTSAASSDARVPLLDANGNPMGSDTMANLASVLGVYTDVKQNLTNSDLNNVKDFGWYVIGDGASSSITNMPKTGGAILDVVGRNTAYIHQFLYYKGSGIIYHRIFNGSSWLDWNELSQDIPAFYKNYSTLAALATALKIETITFTTQTKDIGQIRGILLITSGGSGGALIAGTSSNSGPQVIAKIDASWCTLSTNSSHHTIISISAGLETYGTTVMIFGKQ